MTKQRVLIMGMAVLLAAGAVSTYQSGATASDGGTVEWAPCEADATAECGTLEVPVDWAEPEGDTIELSLTRRKARDPDKRIGHLVYLAGGPGDPGALVIQHGDPDQLFSADLLDRFDIVGFDPRGVGNSNQLTCSDRLLDAKPDSYLRDQADFERRVVYNKRLWADCERRSPDIFGHVDSLSVVRDLDAIRAALGEQRLSAFGFSYGTHLAQQYAEEYPERVRAIVADGNVDHSADTTRWVELKAEMWQDTFDQFVSWCTGDKRCALNGRDVRETWHRLLDRPDLDSYSIVHAAYDCSFGPNWGELARFLHTLDSGAPTPDQPCADEELPEGYPDGRGLKVLNFCADYSLPVADYREWKSLVTRAGREYAPDARVNPNAVDRIADCLGYQEDIPNPQHELDVTGAEPMLLVNPLGDPITGHNQAVIANEQIGAESVLLTYEGAGHTAYVKGGECVTGIVDDYLIDAVLPADGTRCPAVPYEPGR